MKLKDKEDWIGIIKKKSFENVIKEKVEKESLIEWANKDDYIDEIQKVLTCNKK